MWLVPRITLGNAKSWSAIIRTGIWRWPLGAIAVVATASFLLASNAPSAAAVEKSLRNPEVIGQINRIEDYLNQISSMRSRFIQVNPNGSTWQGELDRSAVSARAALVMPRAMLSALGTLDIYGDQHPSALAPVDLGRLAVDLSVDAARWLRVGGRFDRYRFVPTREALATRLLSKNAILHTLGSTTLSGNEVVTLSSVARIGQQSSTRQQALCSRY